VAISAACGTGVAAGLAVAVPGVAAVAGVADFEPWSIIRARANASRGGSIVQRDGLHSSKLYVCILGPARCPRTRMSLPSSQRPELTRKNISTLSRWEQRSESDSETEPSCPVTAPPWSSPRANPSQYEGRGAMTREGLSGPCRLRSRRSRRSRRSPVEGAAPYAVAQAPAPRAGPMANPSRSLVTAWSRSSEAAC
jgi:hypothetical protein